MMAPVGAWAERVRQGRRPAAADNPFIAMQENVSRQVVAGWEAWRTATENFCERLFTTVYGWKPLQAAMGVDAADSRSLRRPSKNPLHGELINKRIAELKSHISSGGLREATIRALLFAGMGRGAVDERGFEALRQIREKYTDVSLAEFKATVREQFYILLLDPEGAMSAIPSMLPPEPETRRKSLELIQQVLSARGELSADDRERLQRVSRLFSKDDRLAVVRSRSAPSAAAGDTTSKAS
jgi:hypothetical protein